MGIFFFRCGAVVVRLFLSRCGPVVLVSIRCGCSCFNSVRLFLFQWSEFILVVDDDVLCAGRLVESSSRAKTL
jgi:hypothetical protein